MDAFEGVSDEPDDDEELAAYTPGRIRQLRAAGGNGANGKDVETASDNSEASVVSGDMSTFVKPKAVRISVPSRPSAASIAAADEELVHVEEDEYAFNSDIDIDAGEQDGVFQPRSRSNGTSAALGASRRKRKVLSPSGEWVFEHELDGRTIVHEPPAMPVRRSDRKLGKRPLTEDSWDHNPFRLVPPKPYGDAAPFQVVVAPQVLITMDFHAHMSVAEVIGLLGGRFEPETRRLYVLSIFPCKSIGTRKECEMDPISEMEAVQQFAAMDLQPVGWYHSHPTFEPSPSCRDIETQTMYQSLFTRPADNTEPFLGFIISPFLKSSKGKSVIECIHLADTIAQDEAFRLPCRVDYIIDDTGEFFEYPGDLVDLYENIQLTYMRTSNYAGLFHEGYFINKLVSRLAGGSYEPSARALLQRFRNKLREHL